MKKLAFVAIVAASFLSTAAYADTVTLTFNPATVSVAPGSTATYTATISAPDTNAAAVFLNEDTYTFSGPQDITIDDSDLFLNFNASLNPGESETFALFTAFVPASEALGSYLGTYKLQGGADGDAQGTLVTQQFTLNVANGTPSSVTPEPSSYLLMASGLLAGFAFMTRKRSASAL